MWAQARTQRLIGAVHPLLLDKRVEPPCVGRGAGHVGLTRRYIVAPPSEAARVYDEAYRAYGEAGRIYDKARLAYNESRLTYGEATRNYDEATLAYNEARLAYAEATRVCAEASLAYGWKRIEQTLMEAKAGHARRAICPNIPYLPYHNDTL